MQLNIFVSSILFFVGYSQAALKLYSNPNCELTGTPFAVQVGGAARFYYKDSIKANRFTAAYPGDKHNLPVRILDANTREAEYDAPKIVGDNTLYVFAVNDKNQVYQRCNLKIKVTKIQVAIISRRNRYHDDPKAGMGGGWGPQLRSFYYGTDGSKWFVHERPGSTVENNPGLDYNRFDPIKGWELVTSLDVKGIQQNMAHISDGNTIFSYGVFRDLPKMYAQLTECSLDMKTTKAGNCSPVLVNGKPYTFDVTSNYVGAARVPEGKLVWFITTALTGFGNGKFTYLFHDGKSWKGPYVTQLGIYDALSYLTTQNIGDGVQAFGGEVEYGHGNVGEAKASSLMAQNYSAVIGFMNYKEGRPATYYKLSYKDQQSESTVRTSDIFFDKVTRRLHVIAKLFPAAMADRKDSSGQILAACQDYETYKNSFRGKRYMDLKVTEHEKLDLAGKSCIKAVQENQKTLYGYAFSSAYGSATVEEIVKNQSLSIEPQVELQAQMARFYYNTQTQELNALLSKGSVRSPKIYNYAFSASEQGKTLNFSQGKLTKYDLVNIVSGNVSAIWVPNANYSPESIKDSAAEFAVTGGSYEYVTSKLRGDGEIYHILLHK